MSSPARILVEDEARIAEVAQGHLERGGHMAVPASSGEDALADLQRRTPDLVTGLELDADGYLTEPFGPRELTARVRALRRKLGEDAWRPELVQTVHGRGYRFAEDRP